MAMKTLVFRNDLGMEIAFEAEDDYPNYKGEKIAYALMGEDGIYAFIEPIEKAVKNIGMMTVEFGFILLSAYYVADGKEV